MSNIVLSGNLNFLGLGDVLQLIGSNGGSGILYVASKYTPEPGLVYFNKGNVVDALSDSLTGLDAAYSLFGWTEGNFEFSHEDVDRKNIVNKNRMEIVLDGLRMVDDGIVKKLGPVSYEDQAASDETVKKEFIYPVIKGPLVDYMYVVSEDQFFEGQTIVEENRHGGWNWTILEGIVDIVKNTKKEPIKIIKVGDGSFIGSVDSLSFQGGVRPATAIASGEVQLGVLDTQRLTTEYTNMSFELKNIVRSLERRLREVTDKAVAIYLKKSNIKKFVKNMKLVMRQSSSELGNCFIITGGEAFVVQHTDIGYLPLAHLGEGDFIGKVPFLDIGQEPLVASVFASKEFKVTKADIKSLEDEYDQVSPMLKSMIENVATSVLVATRVAYDFQKKISGGK
ncbi:MAG: DUF4388 domain-containing protein [Desulfobacteraceae bacterium]|nr:DUF4388 domain-containing protein [Desulfobacteraceae bacterium]